MSMLSIHVHMCLCVHMYLCVHVLMFRVRGNVRVRVHADKRSSRDSTPTDV